MNSIHETLEEISENFKQLSKQCSAEINNASLNIIDSLKNGGKIMFCGNGGSAADSQHLSAELLGRYRLNREPLASIALSTDTSTITAIANDFSFEDIFSRQVDALGKEGDILYAISTSGKSRNIIQAIKTARTKGIYVVGVTGKDSTDMKNICDILIDVPSDRPDRIQEMHISVGQIICEIVENHFFGNS